MNHAAPPKMDTAVEAALTSRRSVRAFLPTPVPLETVRAILDVAARAPSGTNMQPWQAHVVTGAARDRLCRAVLHARETENDRHTAEYSYYPKDFPEPYKARRRKVGWDMYGLLGIGRGDTDKMWAQHNRNFTFFDAPVGIVFTIDKALEIGSWLDLGMFLGNVVTAARGFGLDTCAQAAWCHYHTVVRQELGFGAEQTVVCGMALGHADETAAINRLQTERAPLADWTSWHDA
ncbi:MAG: nitroreductase [Alphaproteobacteria bacterium]|nr:nitroreductase [Alphaproteobacteria bacterium]MCB9931215.1 nitroreductase [Alphaproteobacteria bacterium]